jgi:acetyl-CoA carboxylase biotin carboxyl carrier protein
MDIKEIKSLIKMVMETDISEFELESAEEKIKIKRGGAQEIVHYQGPQQYSIAQPSSLQPVALSGADASVAVTAAVEERGRALHLQLSGLFIGLRPLTPPPMWK